MGSVAVVPRFQAVATFERARRATVSLVSLTERQWQMFVVWLE